MIDGEFSVYFALLLMLLGIIAGGWFALKLAKYFKGRSIKSRLNRGLQKEQEAAKWLKRNGYKIIDYQVSLSYSLKENGVDKKITVSPDFKVSKNGQEQIIEVKSGKAAPRIENKDTRRQLLEYHFIEPDIPLFLLDMENNELKKINFPDQGTKSASKVWLFWLVFALGAGSTVFVFYLLIDS
jgi:hypothetical protein|tara:strand:+ start:209 stop:757 length:549 start_codon:yes stop_codon:yes gene_type:complete